MACVGSDSPFWPDQSFLNTHLFSLMPLILYRGGGRLLTSRVFGRGGGKGGKRGVEGVG